MTAFVKLIEKLDRVAIGRYGPCVDKFACVHILPCYDWRMEQIRQIEFKWITVDEAFVECQQAGLNRTKKTIRSWCRHEHVEGKKQTTPTGERWMLEATSLQVKIKSELDFLMQSDEVLQRSNQGEQVRTEDTPVQTSANPSEPVRTSPNQQEQVLDSVSKKRISELENEIRSLEIDKAVRDRHVDFLSEQNKEGQQNLLSQSRYIGHLETKVLQLGGKPDLTFLKPPTAQNDSMGANPNPRQQQFNVHLDSEGL